MNFFTKLLGGSTLRIKSSTILLLILSSALVMAISGPVQAQTSKADVFTFQNPNGSPANGDVVGNARLHRSAEGAKLTIHTTGLEDGSAYTIWWVIFNNPAECDGGCADTDFGNPAVEASVMNATGRVIADGDNATFSAFLPVGFMHTNPSSGNGRQLFGPGLQNVKGAEIHAVIRSHGLVDILHPFGDIEQFSTVGAGCGGFACFDAQAMVFPLPESE